MVKYVLDGCQISDNQNITELKKATDLVLDGCQISDNQNESVIT